MATRYNAEALEVRKALVNSPDFDALPVEKKRAALQEWSKRYDGGSVPVESPAYIKPRQPLRGTGVDLQPEGTPQVKPTLGPVANTFGVGLDRSMIGQASRAVGHPLIPDGGLREPQGHAEQAGAFITQTGIDLGLGMPYANALGPVGGGAVMSGLPSTLREINAGNDLQTALGNVLTDTTTGALTGRIAEALPGNSLGDVLSRNAAQNVASEPLKMANSGQLPTPQDLATNAALGLALDLVIPGNAPTRKSLASDLETPPRRPVRVPAGQRGSISFESTPGSGDMQPPKKPPQAAAAGGADLPPNRKPPATGAELPPSPEAEAVFNRLQAQAEGADLGPLPVGGEGKAAEPNFKLRNLHSGEDIQRVISETAKAYDATIQDARQHVVSDEQAVEDAILLGMTQQQLMKRQKGQAFNYKEMIAAKKLLEESAVDAQEIAIGYMEKLKAGTDTPAEKLEMLRAIERHAAIQEQYSGASAEAARALRAMQLSTAPGGNTAKQIKNIMLRYGGPENIDKMAEMLANADPSQVPAKLLELRKPTLLDKIATYRQASLMSGIKTPERNLLSTAENAIGKNEFTRAIASPIDWLISTARGTDRTIAGVDLGAMARSAGDMARAGSKNAWSIIKTGQTVDALDNMESPREMRYTGNKYIDTTLNMPFRIASAGDALIGPYANRRFLEGAARVQAINEAKRGQISRGDIAKRQAELVANPSEEMTIEAAADTARWTYNNANFIADTMRVGEGYLRGKSPALGNTAVFLRKQVLPFIKVPINYFSTQFMEGTGIKPIFDFIHSDRFNNAKAKGSINGLLKNIKPEERRAVLNAFAKGAIGWGQVYLGVKLAQAGAATGSSYADPGDKGRGEVANIPRGAIKVGDKWRQVQWVFPMVILGATLAEAGNEPEWAKKIGRTAAAVGGIALEFPAMKGAKDTVAAVQNPLKAGENWAANQTGSYVPSIVNDVAGAIDQTSRKAEGLVEGVEARIPGLRSNVPERTDPLGRTIEQPITDAFDVFRSRKDRTDDPVVAEMVRLNVDVTPPKASYTVMVNGAKQEVPLDQTAQNKVQRKIGELAIPLLQDLMSREQYKSATAAQQTMMIENTLNRSRTAIRAQIKAGLQKAMGAELQEAP